MRVIVSSVLCDQTYMLSVRDLASYKTRSGMQGLKKGDSP